MAHASYMGRAFTDRKGIVREAKELITNVQFDAFVGTGISGTLVAPMLADEFEKGFAIVRKPDVSAHSSIRIEGEFDEGTHWIFVDDLVDSGRTFGRVLDTIESEYPDDNYQDEDTEMLRPKLVGAYLYQEDYSSGRFFTMPQLVEKFVRRGEWDRSAKEFAERLRMLV